MKHRKLMAMLLSLVIALTFMPAVAFADEEVPEGTEPAATELQGETAEQPETPEGTEPAKEEADAKEIHAQGSTPFLEVGNSKIENADTGSGSGTGWEYTPGNHTLKLTGVGAEPGSEPVIKFKDFNLTIEVVGANYVTTITRTDSSDKGDLVITGSGTLESIGVIDAYNVTINGGTVNTKNAGINAKNNITINSGTIILNDLDGHGLEADNVIIKDGNIDISKVQHAGIRANKNIEISGGNIDISEVQAGIFANKNIEISGGNIDINSLYEGIQADEKIEISGGSVTVTSTLGIVAKEIIISGNKTRVESLNTDSRWAILARTGIEILDPLRITLPDNGVVVPWDGYTIVKYGEKKPAAHVVIEPKRETYDILIATAKANGKESIDLSWNKLDGVDGYDVFFLRCNTKKQKYTCEYAGSTDGSATTWSKAALKRRTPYKMYVMAYVMSGDSKTYVAKSPTVHAYTGGGNGRYTNPKSVKVKKSKVTVKKNKTYKIKASVRKLRKGKKLINGRHARKLRYLSSNTSVATVTKYGKIKGVAPGTCDVYVLAVNGSYKKVAVTVK